MLGLKITGLVAILAASVQAQEQYWIDPETVDIKTKTTWCSDQTAACPQLCGQEEGTMTTNANSCDAETLTWECECESGNKPNMTEYSVTVPYHICTRWQENCVRGCYAGNNLCQSECREKHPCGATDPTRVNVTSTATTSTASRTATATAMDADEEEEGEAPKTYTGFGSGDEEEPAADESTEEDAPAAAQSAPAANAAGALEFGRAYGVPVVAAGLFAVFGFAM